MKCTFFPAHNVVHIYFQSNCYTDFYTYEVIRYLPGSKTPTSKFSESKEVRWGSTARKSPIGSTNNQWGRNKTPL
ncbi:hypothetical protein COE30_13305 [Bacillus cereus]|nr:hypothetical protein COE30_13305 [Bacillus cereus]